MRTTPGGATTWSPPPSCSRVLGERFALTPVGREDPSAPAEEWLVDGGPATVGIIASVTRSFCAACDRTRITAEGTVRSCLFGDDETDLRGLLRGGADDAEIADRWRAAMWGKQAGHGIDARRLRAPRAFDGRDRWLRSWQSVRYFAAAAEAAGATQETRSRRATVGELRGLLVERYGEAMARVLANGLVPRRRRRAARRRAPRSARGSTCCRPSPAASVLAVGERSRFGSIRIGEARPSASA